MEADLLFLTLFFPPAIVLLLFYQRIILRWTVRLRPPHLSGTCLPAGAFSSPPVVAIPSHLWCPCPASATGAQQLNVSKASHRKGWKSQLGMAPCAAALVDLFLMRWGQGQAAASSAWSRNSACTKAHLGEGFGEQQPTVCTPSHISIQTARKYNQGKPCLTPASGQCS